jgi:uncharacterized protein (TIGR00369 family)
MTSRRPTHFGIVDRAQAISETGHAFLSKMLDGVHPAPPFAQATDILLTEVKPGRVLFEGRPTAAFYNPLGTVHGGWISALIDSAMGCAVHSLLKPGQAYTTAEMKVHFIRPLFAETGVVRCEGKIVHMGGRLATSEGRVVDESGNLIAHGSETCVILNAG